LPLDELRKISSAFDSDFSDGLSVEAALASKKVPGGTAENSVRAAIAELESRIFKEAPAK